MSANNELVLCYKGSTPQLFSHRVDGARNAGEWSTVYTMQEKLGMEPGNEACKSCTTLLHTYKPHTKTLPIRWYTGAPHGQPICQLSYIHVFIVHVYYSLLPISPHFDDSPDWKDLKCPASEQVDHTALAELTQSAPSAIAVEEKRRYSRIVLPSSPGLTATTSSLLFRSSPSTQAFLTSRSKMKPQAAPGSQGKPRLLFMDASLANSLNSKDIIAKHVITPCTYTQAAVEIFYTCEIYLGGRPGHEVVSKLAKDYRGLLQCSYLENGFGEECRPQLPGAGRGRK